MPIARSKTSTSRKTSPKSSDRRADASWGAIGVGACCARTFAIYEIERRWIGAGCAPSLRWIGRWACAKLALDACDAYARFAYAAYCGCDGFVLGVRQVRAKFPLEVRWVCAGFPQEACWVCVGCALDSRQMRGDLMLEFFSIRAISRALSCKFSAWCASAYLVDSYARLMASHTSFGREVNADFMLVSAGIVGCFCKMALL